MARFVLHTENLDQADTGPLMRYLAEDVAAKMREFAPEDKGYLKAGVSITELDDDHAVITSVRPESGEDREEVPVYVERGTSDTRAQPYMRPALYIYRSP